MDSGDSLPRRMVRFWVNQKRQLLPVVLYFWCAFNMLVFTKNVVGGDYQLLLPGFLLATTAALIMGKVVPMADKLPLMERFRGAPLIQPILFKSLVYTVGVTVFRFAGTHRS